MNKSEVRMLERLITCGRISMRVAMRVEGLAFPDQIRSIQQRRRRSKHIRTSEQRGAGYLISFHHSSLVFKPIAKNLLSGEQIRPHHADRWIGLGKVNHSPNAFRENE